MSDLIRKMFNAHTIDTFLWQLQFENSASGTTFVCSNPVSNSKLKTQLHNSGVHRHFVQQCNYIIAIVTWCARSSTPSLDLTIIAGRNNSQYS